MADVELVINIPEDVYKDIMAHNREMREGAKSAYYFEGLIQHGIPLPKGHGRLVDMKKLQKFVSDYTEYDAIQLILADREDYLPTIIEADTDLGSIKQKDVPEEELEER